MKLYKVVHYSKVREKYCFVTSFIKTKNVVKDIWMNPRFKKIDSVIPVEEDMSC